MKPGLTGVKVCGRRAKIMPWLLFERPKDWDGLAWSRRYLIFPRDSMSPTSYHLQSIVYVRKGRELPTDHILAIELWVRLAIWKWASMGRSVVLIHDFSWIAFQQLREGSRGTIATGTKTYLDICISRRLKAPDRVPYFLICPGTELGWHIEEHVRLDMENGSRYIRGIKGAVDGWHNPQWPQVAEPKPRHGNVHQVA